MCQFFGCFIRKDVKVSRQRLGFEPVEVQNFPAILMPPISAGLCDYEAVHRLSLEDFFNMNELLAVKHENEYRAQQVSTAQ